MLKQSEAEIDKLNNYLIQSEQPMDSKIGDENAKLLIDPVKKLGSKEIESNTETTNK